MRAVVVAGGQGTRLLPYTTILPKALLPIGQWPVIVHILRRLRSEGFEKVELCVGNLGELIRVYLSQATDLEQQLELRWHWEAEPQGTAGALRGLRDYEERLLVINGDVLTTVELGDLWRAHAGSGAALTVATREQHLNIPYGVIEARDGKILNYDEKPAPCYRVSMGVYVLDRRALDHIPEDGAFQFPDLVTALLKAGETVAAYDSDAPWFDIGTVSEYEHAVRYFADHPEVFSSRSSSLAS